jgi:putative FmdB family regulatory protein
VPTYDYECSACGHAFEQWQGIQDAKLRVCPKCKKPKLVRLVGRGAGLIFKGSGFYETDYKRSRTDGGKAPAKEGGASGSGEAAPKPEATKPESAKPEAAKPAGSSVAKKEPSKKSSKAKE